MAARLDGQVNAFRERTPDAGPYTFVWADALTIEGTGRVSQATSMGDQMIIVSEPSADARDESAWSDAHRCVAAAQRHTMTLSGTRTHGHQRSHRSAQPI